MSSSLAVDDVTTLTTDGASLLLSNSSSSKIFTVSNTLPAISTTATISPVYKSKDSTISSASTISDVGFSTILNNYFPSTVSRNVSTPTVSNVYTASALFSHTFIVSKSTISSIFTVSDASTSTISTSSSNFYALTDSNTVITPTVSTPSTVITSAISTPSITITPAVSTPSITITPTVSTPSITITPTVSTNGNVITPSNSTSDSSSVVTYAAIGGVIPLIIIIIAIIVLILLWKYWGKRHRKQGSPTKKNFPPYEAMLEKVTPATTTAKKDIEMISEKAISDKLNSIPLITTNEEEVRTSVGQPTTLHITVAGNPIPEIVWTKNGDPIDHLVLQDSSLHISPTTDDDKGRYTVTASNSEGKSSKTIQLVVLNPQFEQSNVDKKPIKVEDFSEHLAKLQANLCEQFQSDYESIVSETEYTFHAAKLAVNDNKNRYKNILPYDHSRVVLKLQDRSLGSDYINASFIDGYNKINAYIACQGPIESTITEFWRMVWEQHVSTIVNLGETGKAKCYQYWPENVKEFITCGDISVTLVEENVLSNYAIRKLVLKKIKDSPSDESIDFEVQQFHFVEWPDHGVPKYATSMLLFHKSLHIHIKPNFVTPLVVHCSAGIGQTGAFIAIDIELQRIKQEAVVDVYNTVCKIRHKRMSSVQTLAQYMFIYDVLMESVKYANNCITGPASFAKEKLDKLARVNSITKISGYESQFKSLEEVSPKVEDFQYNIACSDENWFKNRSLKLLPPDSSRVHITLDSFHSDYICASYIDGYHQDKVFLAAENPMDSTMNEFWAMVWEKKSHAIVMLSLLEENKVNVSAKYWPNKGEKMEVGNFIVETTNVTQQSHFTRRIIKLKMTTSDEELDARTIHQFQCLCWPNHSCPSEASTIMDLVELVKEVQRQTKNGPIAVHCSDGVGRTGTFCALMICHDRLLAEHMANVFDTVKTIRAQRPGMVENFEQYEFIHKTLVETLDRLAKYSNF